MRRPRVIRKVIRYDRQGQPKVVRDSRAGITVERVRALIDHKCQGRCGGRILPSTVYLLVTHHNRVKFIGPRGIPDKNAYHGACLPEEAKPSLRFFLLPPP